MCQTAVYLVHEGKEELVLQDVVNITPEGATLKLVNLFGEEKVVEGRIRQIDLLSTGSPSIQPKAGKGSPNLLSFMTVKHGNSLYRLFQTL